MNIYNARQTLRTRPIYDLNLKVVYYARVSTDKDEQKSSIANQQDYFDEMIRSNKNWILVGKYVDDGISGVHAETREEFQRMISDAKMGKFDLIVTKEISRFARNTLDSIQYTRQLLSYGVCVWFQNDNINTIDEDSEFRLTIMAGVAQDEIRKLSSRVRFGHAQAIKNGVVLGNSRLYGYDKSNGKLIVNEDEAEMIRIIFKKYASGDWTTPKIEKLLWNMGYRNHNGGKIDKGVINHIIRNPKYKGWYAGGKVKIVDMFTKKQEFIPEEQWNLFKDDGSRVPAIIDEQTWELANKYFDERSQAIKSRRTSFKGENIFTGKIFCAEDNSPYWLKQRCVRGKEDLKWCCSHRIKNGKDSCKSFPIAEEELKIMIADYVNHIVPDFDNIAAEYLELYKRVASSGADSSKEIAQLENLILQLQKKSDKILDYNLSGKISDDEFLRRNHEFDRQIKEARSRITELENTVNPIDEFELKLKNISEKIHEISGIQADDIDRKIVENYIKKILVDPIGDHKANITFYLNDKEERTFFFDYRGKTLINIDFMGCLDNIFDEVGKSEKPSKTNGSEMSCLDNMVKKMIEAQERQMAGK